MIVQDNLLQNRLCSCSAALAACLVVSGCADSGDRPDLGRVTGVVTLDGQSLPGASVSFSQPGFRPSLGSTDSQGRYELIYIRDIKGATVGKHIVKIKLFGGQGGRAKQLPSRYNLVSELTRDVKPGRNEFDFALTSDP